MFDHSIIMFKFREKQIAKEKFYASKKPIKFEILMLIKLLS